MGTPKVGEHEGQEIHYSVGAIVKRDNAYLLIDRKKPPFGFACPAGHIDDGERPREAIEREVREETGLSLDAVELLHEEFVPWNTCARGTEGHYWYVFGGTAYGELVPQHSEVTSIDWFTAVEIAELDLEPVWDYWFKTVHILE